MKTASITMNDAVTVMVAESKWRSFKPGQVLECRVVLCPEEEDGGFSAHCLTLEGVVSQGDTLEEAIENITDAFRETVLYYRDANETIPWGEVDVPRVDGSKEYRILVSF